jgi:hypothetical protein
MENPSFTNLLTRTGSMVAVNGIPPLQRETPLISDHRRILALHILEQRILALIARPSLP